MVSQWPPGVWRVEPGYGREATALAQPEATALAQPFGGLGAMEFPLSFANKIPPGFLNQNLALVVPLS